MHLDFKNEDNLQGILSMKVEEADYAPNVLDSLKKYQKSMSFPGFRKGKAPIGLVKKQIGDDLLKEEVNKVVVDSVNNYMNDNKDKFIFQPLALDTKIDWEKDKNFLFEFKLALKPEFDLDVDSLKKIETFKVEISDEELNAEIEELRNQYGDIEQLEESAGGEYEVMVFRVQELNDETNEPLDGGFTKTVRLDYKNYSDAFKKLFKGAKKDDQLTVNIKKDLPKKDVLAAFEMESKVYSDLSTNCLFTIQGAINLTPAELNETFFERVFGDAEINTEEAFRTKLNQLMTDRYGNRETNRLATSVKDFLLENVTVELSETYMKEWVERNEEDTDKQEEKIAEYMKSAKWDLISNRLAEKYELSVNQEEVKAAIRLRFFSEGMAYYKSQEEIEQMVEQFYNYEGYRLGVEQNILDTKITKSIQENVTLKTTKVSKTQFEEKTKQD